MNNKKIVLIFDVDFAEAMGHYVLAAFKNMGYEAEVVDRRNLKKILDIQPLFVLAVDDGAHYIYDIDYHPAFFWAVDTHVTFGSDKYMTQSFDGVFVAQKKDVPKIAIYNKNTWWLPLACDLECHGGTGEAKRYDVASVGNYSPNNSLARARLREKLSLLYPSSFIGSAPHEKIGEIYGASKIVFNLPIKYDINMRVFEAMCSGSLLITKEIKDNGSNELYTPGQDCIVFDGSADDLLAKIEYYLSHDKERETIALQGRNVAVARHTYRHRAGVVLEKYLASTSANFNRVGHGRLLWLKTVIGAKNAYQEMKMFMHRNILSKNVFLLMQYNKLKKLRYKFFPYE